MESNIYEILNDLCLFTNDWIQGQLKMGNTIVVGLQFDRKRKFGFIGKFIIFFVFLQVLVVKEFKTMSQQQYVYSKF